MICAIEKQLWHFQTLKTISSTIEEKPSKSAADRPVSWVGDLSLTCHALGDSASTRLVEVSRDTEDGLLGWVVLAVVVPIGPAIEGKLGGFETIADPPNKCSED